MKGGSSAPYQLLGSAGGSSGSPGGVSGGSAFASGDDARDPTPCCVSGWRAYSLGVWRPPHLYKVLGLLAVAVLFVQYTSNAIMFRPPQPPWVSTEIVYSVSAVVATERGQDLDRNDDDNGAGVSGGGSGGDYRASVNDSGDGSTVTASNVERRQQQGLKNETCAILRNHLDKPDSRANSSSHNATGCPGDGGSGGGGAGRSNRPCPLIPPRLVGRMKILDENISFDDIEALHRDVELGGRHRPAECTARHRVAVVVPYRDREEHLRKFLHNIHPMLKRQQLDYEIFVVEQNGTYKFNRAKLLNIGYLEALKLYPFQCFIFHDVDLIPEDDRNLYSCPDQPRHMSVAVDTMQYKLPYANIFGGVSALSKRHMVTVNGFSNEFWGWGGEDDDMSARIRYHRLKITRYPASIARYKMLTHKKDTPNPERYKFLHRGRLRYRTDGINSCKYKVLNVVFRRLYTWILVDPLPPKKRIGR